jgi:hypothetical protein
MIRTAFLLALLATPLTHAAPDLVTVSERSGFQATGRYDEVVTLCRAFQQAYPKQVKCFQFGTTPEGRPMLALAVNARGTLTPDAARKAGLPVTLVQGGIHAGEIDGKDAGFLALREILEGRLAKNALDQQVLVFVPVFNVDGHERFAKWNRPNQRGPVEMGWRTTAQNFNLNRDYVKADAPEMQAMLALVNAWDPLTYVDLHVTDGAQFQHDVSIQVEPVYSGDPEFRKAGLALRDEVVADLQVQAPGAGYVVPAAWAQTVAAKLTQHGIAFRRLDKAIDAAPARTFRAEQATFAATSFESHQRLTVAGAWKAEPRNLARGALFVPIAQPKARLVMALFEPQAPDSLLAWGEFNNAFEPKEYMEDYVAEDVAREQMARDPALAAAFRNRLEHDPAFAGNPHARREFFARRHPSWDERLNLYPVLRTDVAL